MKTSKTMKAFAVSWLVIVCTLSIFIAVPPRAAAQTITVTNPNASSVWYTGSTYTIQWSSVGGVGPFVMIEYDWLYYTSYTAITIASSTSNDGSYSWTVPGSISSDTDYLIRVTDLSDTNVYDDSELFEIIHTTGSGTITVTAPTATDIWYTGSTYDIRWTSSGSVGPNVEIEYEPWPLGSPVTITSSTPTSPGRYSWTVPSSLTGDAYYMITVRDASDANIEDQSLPFIVRPGSNMMLIIAIVAIIAIVLIIVVVAVVLVARKKKPAPMPPQANIPVAPPASQYAPPQYQPQYAQQQQAPGSATKMCINCGKSIPADFTFCIHCGGRT